MMKITVLAVGSLKEPFWREAQAEYSKRLVSFAKLEIIGVEPMPVSATVSSARSMEVEAERLVRRIPKGAAVVVLDRQGKEWSSEEVAHYLDGVRSEGREACFVIGGSDGLGEAVMAAAERRWSISRLTFPHELARIILLEQLYRGFCISAGKPYHK
jgi:23S rRNA (pseudouridine1915-N3)-methyltransferase